MNNFYEYYRWISINFQYYYVWVVDVKVYFYNMMNIAYKYIHTRKIKNNYYIFLILD